MRRGMKDMLVMSKFLKWAWVWTRRLRARAGSRRGKIHHEDLGIFRWALRRYCRVADVEGDFRVRDSGRAADARDAETGRGDDAARGQSCVDLNGMTARIGRCAQVAGGSSLGLAATGVVCAKPERLIMTSHLEVWTFDPNFFHHRSGRI